MKVDGVASELIKAIQETPPPAPISVGLSWEATQQPGRNITLRLLQHFHPKHPIAVDVLLKSQGDDLYVKFDLVAAAWIAHYQRALYGAAVLTLWLVLFGVFWISTDAHHALAVSFAGKYFPGNPPAGVAVLVTGWNVTTNSQELLQDPLNPEKAFVRGKPWSFGKYFRADPFLFLQTVARTPAVIMALAAGIMLLVPRYSYRYACLWIGWPPPEDFEVAFVAYRAWIERIFYDMMLREYGVTKADTLEIETP